MSKTLRQDPDRKKMEKKHSENWRLACSFAKALNSSKLQLFLLLKIVAELGLCRL